MGLVKQKRPRRWPEKVRGFNPSVDLFLVPESVSAWILQVQFAVLLGLEVNNEAVVFIVFDDVGHVD